MLLKTEKSIMKKNNTLLFSVLPFYLALLSLLLLRFNNQINQPLFDSFFWGFLIPVLNHTIGHYSKKWGLKKADKSFLLLTLGGMVLRMFLTLVLIILVLNFLNVSLYSFIFTTFISYFYFLILEIINLSGNKPNF